jgi:hypothetical protein
MTAIYSKQSPYFLTTSFGPFLDVLNFRSIPQSQSDTEYIIDNFYKFRPDLLAYDLYDDVGLWWVFAVRNPNVLIDPVFDFLPGNVIFIPKKETLTAQLGI